MNYAIKCKEICPVMHMHSFTSMEKLDIVHICKCLYHFSKGKLNSSSTIRHSTAILQTSNVSDSVRVFVRTIRMKYGTI